MNRNLVVVHKPQLVRKRSQIILPKSVSVVIRPSRSQVTTLKALKQPPAKPAHKPIPRPQAGPKTPPNHAKSQAAVSIAKPLLKKRRVAKKGEVRYVTREASPESAQRVARLRNSGREKILIIIGNGPSITEAPLEKLLYNSKIEILTVNRPDYRIWPTNYWVFFDTSQLRRNEDLWNSYEGIIINSTAIKRQKHNSMQVKNRGGRGWSRDLMDGLHIGRSSVYASMQIGQWMGYDHIYIFGCDMDPEGLNGKLHFYGHNPDAPPDRRGPRFQREADFYDHAATVLTPEERQKFTFCSAYNKWGFVDKFNRLDHREAVEVVLAHAERLKSGTTHNQ